MKKFTISLLSATAFIASPAVAGDNEFYVGVGAGGAVSEDISLRETPTDEIVVDTDLGWEAEGVLGYDAGPVRLEVEGAYKRIGVEAIDAGLTGVPGRTTATGVQTLTDVIDPSSGDLAIWSGMVNALLDFGGNDGIGVSLGGGVGISNASLEKFTANTQGPGFIDDDDARFAWQAIAQLRVPLTDADRCLAEVQVPSGNQPVLYRSARS